MRKKLEIKIQIEKGAYVIREIEPISPKNMLLMNLKNAGRKNE